MVSAVFVRLHFSIDHYILLIINKIVIMCQQVSQIQIWVSSKCNVSPQMSKMFSHQEMSQKTDNEWTNSRTETGDPRKTSELL